MKRLQSFNNLYPIPTLLDVVNNNFHSKLAMRTKSKNLIGNPARFSIFEMPLLMRLRCVRKLHFPSPEMLNEIPYIQERRSAPYSTFKIARNARSKHNFFRKRCELRSPICIIWFFDKSTSCKLYGAGEIFRTSAILLLLKSNCVR